MPIVLARCHSRQLGRSWQHGPVCRYATVAATSYNSPSKVFTDWKVHTLIVTAPTEHCCNDIAA